MTLNRLCLDITAFRYVFKRKTCHYRANRIDDFRKFCIAKQIAIKQMFDCLEFDLIKVLITFSIPYIIVNDHVYISSV